MDPMAASQIVSAERADWPCARGPWDQGDVGGRICAEAPGTNMRIAPRKAESSTLSEPWRCARCGFKVVSKTHKYCLPSGSWFEFIIITNPINKAILPSSSFQHNSSNLLPIFKSSNQPTNQIYQNAFLYCLCYPPPHCWHCPWCSS